MTIFIPQTGGYFGDILFYYKDFTQNIFQYCFKCFYTDRTVSSVWQ